jgi:hypothetical protein
MRDVEQLCRFTGRCCGCCRCRVKLSLHGDLSALHHCDADENDENDDGIKMAADVAIADTTGA